MVEQEQERDSKAIRRESILDATVAVLAERPLNKLTMDEVAEKADVSKGTLYLYFQSKEALLLALSHRPLDTVLRRFEALAAEERTGIELVEDMLRGHMRVIREHATSFRIAMSSLFGGAPQVCVDDYSDRIAAVRGGYIDALERGIEDGSIRKDVVSAQAAAALWAGLFGASLLRINAKRMSISPELAESVRYDDLPDALCNLLIHGLAERSEA